MEQIVKTSIAQVGTHRKKISTLQAAVAALTLGTVAALAANPVAARTVNPDFLTAATTSVSKPAAPVVAVAANTAATRPAVVAAPSSSAPKKTL